VELPAAGAAQVTDGQIRAARDRLIATYRQALRQGDGAPAVERLVLRNAVAANSAAAAHRLATRWSSGVAGPMDDLASTVSGDDLLSRSMWPGGSILLAHLGVARVALAFVLGLIAWLLRPSMLPDMLQVTICAVLLVVIVYVLRAPMLLYERSDEMDRWVGQLLDPAQREFFQLAGGPPPMTEPATLIRTSVRSSARLVFLGFLGLVLSPLVVSALSIVRSAVTGT
jgi:hypothetical protein